MNLFYTCHMEAKLFIPLAVMYPLPLLRSNMCETKEARRKHATTRRAYTQGHVVSAVASGVREVAHLGQRLDGSNA